MTAEKNYAEALFNLAVEGNCLDLVFNKLSFVKENILPQKKFLDLLLSPNVTFSQKKDVLTKIFLGCQGDSKENKLIMNFFLVLIKRNSVFIISLIIDCFFDMYYKHENILQAKIYSAVELSDHLLSIIANILESKYKANVILDNIIDRRIIAGFSVEINGAVVDLGLESRLDKLKRHLLDLYLEPSFDGETPE